MQQNTGSEPLPKAGPEVEPSFPNKSVGYAWGWYCPYRFTLLTLAIFVIFAFIADTPADIAAGLWRIICSRSLLVTDYIAVGGIGAALINAALTGLFSVLSMMLARVRPNGALIMAIWLTIGFSFFGKNIFNMLPIMGGVWLYSRFQREPFLNYSLVALLSSTLAPVVSEFTFMGRFHPVVEMVAGITVGLAVGFIIPIISEVTTRVHGGYNLYNVGFAGGIIAMFIVAFSGVFGIEIEKALYWSEGNNLFWAVFLYLIFTVWFVLGLVGGHAKENINAAKKILGHSGRLVTDFYLMYDGAVYLNMGAMGIVCTTITLLLGAPLNGASLAGIFTVMAFAAFGKHLRNCLPVIAGAVIMALINPAPPTDPSNICGILFCTGLAPIAGQFGVGWGVLAGALHIAVVTHIGGVTGGLNLYNNGFAAGFVALVLVPIILAFSGRKKKNET